MTKDYKRNKRPFFFFLFLLVSFVTQQIRRQHTHAVGGVAAHLFYFFFVVVVLFILKKNVETTVGASSSDIQQLSSWDKNPSYPFRHSSLYMFVFSQPKDEKKNDFNPLVIIISFPPLFCWLGANRKKKMRKVNMSSNFTRQRMKKEGENECVPVSTEKRANLFKQTLDEMT